MPQAFDISTGDPNSPVQFHRPLDISVGEFSSLEISAGELIPQAPLAF